MINSSKELSEVNLSTQVELKSQQAGTKLDIFFKQCKFFQKVVLLGQSYDVGDNVFVKTLKHQAVCLGKILRLMTFPQQNNTHVPLFEIQWFKISFKIQRYCSKYDIAEHYKDFFEYFSEFELFLSEQTNVLFLDCITRSFTVLQLEEFDKMDEVPVDTYFCRSHYDIKKQTLNPMIDQWKKTCLCQKPLNPDLLYIQCEGCQTWYHLQCIGLTQEQADLIEQYSCKKCQQLIASL